MKTLERWILKVLRGKMQETEGVTLLRLRCLRCEHQWWPVKLEMPISCPKCRSRYWNKPRVRKPRRHRNGNGDA